MRRTLLTTCLPRGSLLLPADGRQVLAVADLAFAVWEGGAIRKE